MVFLSPCSCPRPFFSRLPFYWSIPHPSRADKACNIREIRMVMSENCTRRNFMATIKVCYNASSVQGEVWKLAKNAKILHANNELF